MSPRGWREVPPAADWVAMEERVLAFWRERDVFRRSLEARRGSPPFVFYEGPPTANGPPRRAPRPLARLQGHLPALPDDARALRRPARRLGLPRPAGGDRGRAAAGHLRQAADRGVRHRRVQRPLPRVGGRLRRRVGAADRADRVLDRHRAGLPDDGRRLHRERLVEPRRAVPARPARPERQGRALLPACGTALSSHEVALGYEEVEDPSIFVRFPLADAPGESLLVWTTTPWTLPANQAAAVNPDVSYAAVEREGETLILAEALVERVLGEGAVVARRVPAGELVGPRYRRAVPLRRRPARGGRGRLRDDRGRHGHRPHRPGLRRGRHGRGAAARLPGAEPGRSRRALHGGGRALGRPRREGGRPRPRRRPRRAGAAAPRRDPPPPVPPLLALRHAAPLLRQALVVRPHDRGRRPDAGAQPPHRLAPRARARRPLRPVARGQRRLVDLARPLLGHAAAPLALRRLRPHRRRRLLRGAARPRDPGAAGALRPAPAVRGRGRADLRLRRRHGARARGHRRLVRQRRDAVRPGPPPVRHGRGPGGAASRPTSSARPSTRRGAGSTPCSPRAPSSSTRRPTATSSAWA